MRNPCSTEWGKKWINLDCYDPRLDDAAIRVERFCGRWFHHDTERSLLVISGQPCCGKTHLAKAIARFARAAAFKALEANTGWTRVPSLRFIRWPEAVDRAIRERVYGDYEDAMDCDLVVLDDIGAEDDPHRSGVNKLCQILSRRETMFTVATTNIEPEKWSSKWDMRVADRLIRNSDIIDLNGVEPYSLQQQQ